MMTKNKKAQSVIWGEFESADIFTFIIFSFLVVVFFAGLIYAMGLVNDAMHNAGLTNEVNANQSGYVNMTLAADQTFGVVNNSIGSLRMVALVYILGLAACMIITNGLVRRNPIWFFIYIMIALVAVIFAPQVTNAYESLRASGVYGGELESFTASNMILRNLPVVVLVISIFGGILMLVNLIRSPAEQGGL